MPTVFSYEVFDARVDMVTVAPFKRTKDQIHALGGMIIADTAEEVRDEDLDNSGAYVPEPIRPIGKSRQAS